MNTPNMYICPPANEAILEDEMVFDIERDIINNSLSLKRPSTGLPQVLCITSYPPRECGIATYSQDLVAALNNKFSEAFSMKICAIESLPNEYEYAQPPAYILNASDAQSYSSLANDINNNPRISVVFIQHEFGLFSANEASFLSFLQALEKPVVITFHTILPKPNKALKTAVQHIASLVSSIIVMTNKSVQILYADYKIEKEKIAMIPHGTHLIVHRDKAELKAKYGLVGKKILSTLGLLGSGKSIETTINALPAIVANHPDVLFLIIGKTHPNIVQTEGEQYRNRLKQMIVDLQLQDHVKFINAYLPLPDLLEYLQLTDIYLFTSKDRTQAVSGTFSYAISCGCPIISTPIPHAKEVLKNDAGILVDFEDSKQLADAVNMLLADETKCRQMSANGVHRIAPTSWENTATAHAYLFNQLFGDSFKLTFNLPKINLQHFKNMTTEIGFTQFANLNQPNLSSGYTLDDNARAMVAIISHSQLTNEAADVDLIHRYFQFIKQCFQQSGSFLNYMNQEKAFTNQNYIENLEDSNGRAIWSIGYLISLKAILPPSLIAEAIALMQRALSNVTKIHSTRAMAFAIKGLYYENNPENMHLLTTFANRLVQMYRHEKSEHWQWFEHYLTYGNSILPESMLCAYLATNDLVYKKIAKESFDFLLSKTFTDTNITVISNKGWLFKGEKGEHPVGGEQPIDVAYSILALQRFYAAFDDKSYLNKMNIAFSWFLGNNRLHQIVYNPCTGGCFDGLEDHYINLNQGAESTVSYLMARLAMEHIAPFQASLKVKNRELSVAYLA